jgi:hypothetical protein
MFFCAEAAAITFETIALRGAPAPGAPNGAVFDTFVAPSLNNSGEVAFIGWLRDGFGGVDGDFVVVWDSYGGPGSETSYDSI